MTIQGTAIFLAQFMGDEAPFNSFDSICAWASELGYLGVQVPSCDPRCFDLEKAAKSKAYCEEIQGVAASHGLEITELSTHLQGQLVAVHPAYDAGFDGFARIVRGYDPEGGGWAEDGVTLTIDGGCGTGGSLFAACLAPDGTLLDRVEA